MSTANIKLGECVGIKIESNRERKKAQTSELSSDMYSIVLPGLESGDDIDIEDTEYDASFVCPLTMNEVGDCFTGAFLVEMHMLNFNKEPMLVQNVKESDKMGLATIRGCGHQFGALPLLYNIMSREMRCPICRGGSNKQVNTKQMCSGIDKGIWNLLCMICDETKERYKKETIEEEQSLIRQEHAGLDGTFEGLNFESIIEIVAFRVIFSIYREAAHSSGNSANQVPVAVLAFALKHSYQFDDVEEDEKIVFSCGESKCFVVLELSRIPNLTCWCCAGRSSGRHLSRSLRLGTTFDVRVVADVFDQTLTVFDSNRLTYPVFSRPRVSNLCVHVPSHDNNSDCINITYEKCAFDPVYVMRVVEFYSTVTHIQQTLHDFYS